MLKRLAFILALVLWPSIALADFNNPQGAKKTFTPTFTFGTPGDLSIAWTTQTGVWSQIGQTVCISITLSFTPTYTTASGNATITLTGLPNADTVAGNVGFILHTQLAGLTYPASKTVVVPRMAGAGNSLILVGLGSAQSIAALTVTQIPSGTAQFFGISGCYLTN